MWLRERSFKRRLKRRLLKRMKPAARPAKAKALQGKIGKSQDWGAPRMWQPSMEDSSGQGSQVGRQGVYRGGVRRAIAAAAAVAGAANAASHRQEPGPVT